LARSTSVTGIATSSIFQSMPPRYTQVGGPPLPYRARRARPAHRAAVAEVCAALLPTADDVRVLATSRETVGIVGEVRYRLPPLTVPEPDTRPM